MAVAYDIRVELAQRLGVAASGAVGAQAREERLHVERRHKPEAVALLAQVVHAQRRRARERVEDAALDL